MKYFVLFTVICLAAVTNAQVTWFKASMVCNTKYSQEDVKEFTHFISGQKLMVELRKDGFFYANSAPCDNESSCKTDTKVTTTCTKLGKTDNYVSLSSGGATAKVSAASLTGSDPTAHCTVLVGTLISKQVPSDLGKCAKVQRLTAAADTALSAVTYSTIVADEDCTANAATGLAVSTTCVVLPLFGSAIVKDSVYQSFPGDNKCGVSEDSDNLSIPSEGTCTEYAPGKYGKYTVADGSAAVSYECTDDACSTSCKTQALKKDVCTMVGNASMLYGSLGLSGGAIAGIVIGTILGIALIAGVVIVVVKKSGGASSSAV